MILSCLDILCDQYQEQRVGQIIFNYICSHCPNNDSFYIEDIDLLRYLQKEIEKILFKYIDNYK